MRSRTGLLSASRPLRPRVTWAANGCFVAGSECFAGVASAVPLGGLNLTGQRNVFRKCQIAGIGHASMDIAGAYSLKLAAAQENYFDECYIGLDTVTLGAAANSQILCSAAATRNIFKKCIIATYTNHATNNNFLRAPTGSLDRWMIFDDCLFINPVDASSTALTQAAIVASDAGGSVLISGSTSVVGATDFNSTDSGNVRALLGGAATTATTLGLGLALTR